MTRFMCLPAIRCERCGNQFVATLASPYRCKPCWRESGEAKRPLRDEAVLSLARAMRRLRDQRGLSIAEVAAEFHVSKSTAARRLRMVAP